MKNSKIKTVITVVQTVDFQDKEWIELFKKKYPHSIWLNPSYHYGDLNNMYWMESERVIRENIDMFPLTVDGLKRGIKTLMV